MTHTAPRAAVAASLLALALSGCAAGAGAGRYPSLAQREAERAQGQFAVEPARTIAVPPVDLPQAGPLADRLAALVAQGTAAHGKFAAARPSATRASAAAAGSAVGSDAWATAQVALAELDSARSEAAIPLGELDALYVAATVAAEESGAIAAARDQVAGLVAEEDAVLERLRAQVR